MAAPPIAERHLHHFHRRSPIKETVRAATTANITITTALNNGDTLDGITLATDDRVLVKNQTAGAENGIYIVGTSPARSYDVSTDDPAFGYLVLVLQGTTNAGTLWQNTNTTAPTIGSTSLTFSQFSGGGSLTDHTHAATGSGSNGGGATLTPGVLNLPTATSPAQTADGSAVWDSDDDKLTIGTGAARKTLVNEGAVTSSGLTQATARLLGRTTASTGAIEEITVGSGLTLSAGDLSATGGGSGTVTTVKDEGTNLSTAVVSIDFVGAGVTATGTTAVTVTIPGGGGASHSYIGYNTVGGTAENVVANRVIAKSFTLGAAGTLTSIEIYVDTVSDSVSGNWLVGVWDDNSSAIGTLKHITGSTNADAELFSGTGSSFPARWVSRPCGIYLAAGTYWMGMLVNDVSGTIRIYRDGSGSDRRLDSGGAWIPDGQRYTQTDTTFKYSIRGNLLT